jgi:hypothetical protein
MESLSNYTLSRPSSPINTETIPKSDVVMPSAEDKKATDAFLARLKAKVEATDKSHVPTTPIMPTATIQYTPKPEGGFPVVYGRNSTHAFDNIDLVQITDWMNLPGPRVFIQPLSHGFYPPAIAQEIVGVLQSTVKDIFACEKVKVTAPMASSAPTNVDHAPYTYLMRNIPAEVATTLINQQCWATEKIGFMVYTAEAIMPQYLGAVEGLNATDDEDVGVIRDLIARTLYDSEVGPIIAEISEHDPSLAYLEAPERAATVMKTLRIRMINIRAQGGTLRPIANIYINCPFESDTDWTRLVEAVAQTKFKHSLLGTGTIHRGWMCTICHGADHPSGLCPFPSIPGWIKATPIAPIVEHRNRLNRQARDSAEARRGRGGSNRPGRGGSTHARSNTNWPHGS